MKTAVSLVEWLARRTQGLRKDIADTGNTALYLRQLLRGNRAPILVNDAAAGRAGPVSAQPPVLLVQGYLATRGSVQLLGRRLTERGHLVFGYRLGFMNMGDIRDSAALIARKVESLVAQTAVRRVDLVGHSMGGLVGLYYVKRLGGRQRVRRLILLGTPATGTWSALLGLATAPFGRAGLQLLPASPFMRDLAAVPLPEGVEVISVGGARDFFAPLGSTVLAGVRHVAVDTGHSGLLVDSEVVNVIDGLLKAP